MDTGREMLITFSGALGFGVLFSLIAYRLRISSIVILLLGGVLVGPEGIGWINPDHLGQGLKTIISLAVGLILFEGGLTLDIKEYELVSKEIKSILTKGILVTWLLSALAIRLCFAFPWDFSLLAASLIIVTGPTVIGPLLKRIRVKRHIQNILHWEGVLIDPIGVFITLLCYEWIVSPEHNPFTEFMKRTLIGISFGVTGGFFISHIVKRRWLPPDSINITFLASALGIFTISDILSHESGLLSVTIAGFVIGYLQKGKLDQVKAYKAELIQLLVGLLFVLLAANLKLHSFMSFGIKTLYIVLFIMFVVRPCNIFISLMGSPLSIKEKFFLSWVAPRGIVAASMASLFVLNLAEHGNEYAPFLETFTYSVIAGTVLFQGLTAGWMGRILRVLEPMPKGWAIIGAHQLGIRVASFIKTYEKNVVLIDLNRKAIIEAKGKDLSAIQGNVLIMNFDDYPEVYGIGNVLAITENEELNTLICQRWKREFPHVKTYRWARSATMDHQNIDGQYPDGRVVWEHIRLAQFAKPELGEGMMSIETQKSNLMTLPETRNILMCSYQSMLCPYIPNNENESCTLLVACPSAKKGMQLTRKMQPNWLMISNATGIEEALWELISTINQDYPTLDIKEIYNHLLDYEKKYVGLICPDTLLPHTYSKDIKEPVVLIAKLLTPIQSSHSDERISIIIIVISPEDKPRKHLDTLSDISQFFIDDENRNKLLAVQTHTELVTIFFPSCSPEEKK